MIGEKFFIENYNFFWNSTLPMTNFFLRKVNTGLFQQQDVFFESDVIGRRRSFTSELAFQIFSHCTDNKKYIEELGADEINHIESRCREKFKNFKEDDILEISKELNEIELTEVLELAKRLISFFNLRKNALQTNPKFKGCGFLETCYGDVIANDTLYEVKMVDRNLQAIDCKQILTYCALNYLSNEYEINNIAFYNPRRGVHFDMNIDRFTLLISGKPSSELFGEVLEFLSGEGISK